MRIEAIQRTVYRSPRAGRCYMTLRAAIMAEARKIIEAKYPSERADYHDGRMTYPGFYWKEMPRADVMYRRLARLIRAAYLKTTTEGQP